MKKCLLFIFLICKAFGLIGQTGWKITNSPGFQNRVDDIYMVNTLVGYAVCGDGKIVKSIDGGENWITLFSTDSVYFRSVEFIDQNKGFVGGFPRPFTTTMPNRNILQKTLDGGQTWTDLTALIPGKAKRGICGLAVADVNTILGCGNWFQDSAYIIKSIDGGLTWNLIDMSSYASSLIDMYFINKDTGFAVGAGPLPLETAVILYTTNGGLSWSYKFQNTIAHEYCWKIQHLKNKVYFASIEDATNVATKILKSIDGGMSWTVYQVSAAPYYLQGVGFIDELVGWAGGGHDKSYETKDGGINWNVTSICPNMNRVFRVNDTLLFATGNRIWKYQREGKADSLPVPNQANYVAVKCYPNPVSNRITIDVELFVSTHILVMLFDNTGKRIKVLENDDRPAGNLKYSLQTDNLPAGVYYIFVKTHEDRKISEMIVSH